jgi:D-alanine-D-alanine ligase
VIAGHIDQGRQLVLIFGGPGPEHEVGLASALSVREHLTRRGWTLLEAGVTKDGRWLVGTGALHMLLGAADPMRLPAGLDKVAAGLAMGVDWAAVRGFGGPPPSEIFTGHRMAFLACHGKWGQDGSAHRLLDSYGLSSVGCDGAATALCFNKPDTKKVLSDAGLPVARGVTVTAQEFAADPQAARDRVRTELGGGAWFVKPARSGSSVGIARVDYPHQFDQAVGGALRWDSVALVEEYVPHREFVVGVMGNDRLVLSPPGECIPVGHLYTYEEKYRLGNPRFTCPAELDEPTVKHLNRLSARVYRALGCAVMARMDFFLDARDGRLLINEVNSTPGLTQTSVFPKVMAAAGYRYPDLLEELCRLAASDGAEAARPKPRPIPGHRDRGRSRGWGR